MSKKPKMRPPKLIPRLDEDEAQIKFATYLNYLRFFKEHLSDEYESQEALVEQTLKKAASLEPCANPDRKWVQRFLKIAWNTEFLLAGGVNDPELVRINNQWAPIQAYYLVYAASEALGQLIDGSPPNSHAKALRKTTYFLTKHGLSPWDKVFTGARGKDRCSHRPLNFPENLVVADSNLRRIGVVPVEMIAKCLKAEHSNRIDEYKRKKNGPFQYAHDPGHTGVLHFLYRLRLKSNYKEVDIFVQETSDYDAYAFFDCLLALSRWTLFHIEVMIIRKLGVAGFAYVAKNYLKINSRAEDLKRRLAHYQSLVAK